MLLTAYASTSETGDRMLCAVDGFALSTDSKSKAGRSVNTTPKYTELWGYPGSGGRWTSRVCDPSAVNNVKQCLASQHDVAMQVVAWLSGSALVSIDVVTLRVRRARLVLGWVTVCG